ncbi:uncharacterized protein LOC115323818 isoform X2 [Ixodes scapularis]|uniref:uncharacterized protein LOC115323818 isoform X2 n=1 Tax=Ixodes scapularis TaxID=6945 RepID=UPI00116165D0|nr:uncharacterized protein LOC115323818 isoform X2 [Ixodes scapularis]
MSNYLMKVKMQLLPTPCKMPHKVKPEAACLVKPVNIRQLSLWNLVHLQKILLTTLAALMMQNILALLLWNMAPPQMTPLKITARMMQGPTHPQCFRTMVPSQTTQLKSTARMMQGSFR